MKYKNKLKAKILSIFLILFIGLSIIPVYDVQAEIMETSAETEIELGNIIETYGEENIIFENGIVLTLGENADINNILTDVNEEIILMSNNEEIITVDGQTAMSVAEGTTFLIAQEGEKYHVLEVYVEDPEMMIASYSSAIVNRDHYVAYIDIGHGGKDPGASGNGIIEKNYNLNIGLKVRDRLRNKGIEVVMNRESDVYVNFKDTAAHANSVTPDVFVSLHSNAATAKSANGIETFYSKEIDIPLGTEVHNRLISSTGATNRGLKDDTYYVTNHTKMPAILVENGFVTNEAEAEKMKQEYYQEYIINSIVDGVVAYLKNNIDLNPGKPLTATRIFGQNRYETSYEIFERGWESSSTAVLVTGSDYADALTSAPLAAKYDAPILLVEKTSLANQSKLKDILKRKGVTSVYIVGGVNAIPSSLESELSNMGIKSARLSGSDRYATSVSVAKEINSGTGEVAVAYGLDFADGLSISAVASIRQMPILLTPTNSIPAVISDYINNNGINKSYIIGSETVVSKNVENSLPSVERLGGANRYETNNSVFNKFRGDLNLTNMYIASALDFPDALSSTALAARNHSFVLLTNTYGAEGTTKNILNGNRESIDKVCVLGGSLAIKDQILYDLGITSIQ